MTNRKLYEYTLMELNKVRAPSLHLEDFLYIANKGVQEYINERYTLYQTTQQLTDDLQALNTTVEGVVGISNTNLPILTYTGGYTGVKAVVTGKKYNSDYVQSILPDNYMHLLNCMVDIANKVNYKCTAAGTLTNTNAKRLTSDIGAGIHNNAFLKPDYRSPYYSIVNDYITNEKQGAIQIYYGDIAKFQFTGYSIDYIKTPQVITLTTQERDSIADISDEMEFPEYVCNEIIKRIVKLILENQSNPRLQTNIPINQTIQ